MKLRLPKCLMILALAALPHAWAAAVIGSGVSYDNGKGSYSQNTDANPTWIEPGSYRAGYGDDLYCWANSAANMIQYWQDTYGDKLADSAPDGFNSTVYGVPEGTRYLDVYEYFLSKGESNQGGLQSKAIDWYFKQKNCDGLKANDKQVLKNAADAPVASSDNSYQGGEHGISHLGDALSKAFSQQGQSVGLSIWQQDPADLLLSPEEFWDKFNTRSHAVTCWGYETDASGTVSALYLTDSDDMEFGVFKVHVAEGDTLPYMGMDSYRGVILSTDDDIDGYGGFVVSVQGVFTLETPATDSQGNAYAKSAVDGEGNRLVNALTSSDKQLMENTVVSGAVTRTGAGVKVGGENEDGVPQIVMLVSDGTGSSLTLTGKTNPNSFGVSEGSGLEVAHGSLASLANLGVSGYEHGIDAQGKVYLYGDTVNVTGNTSASGNGAGINNANYVEIYGAGEVNITGNKATNGKGGGIYNAKGEVLSIRGNGDVNFSGNTAASGNDIYNDGGKVNIAGNGGVQFLGTDAEKAAVVNNGELYLKSGVKEDVSVAAIRFDYSALDSRGGTTCVGRDMYGETSATNVYFTGKKTSDGDESMMILSANPKTADVAATLDHLKVNAWEIAGAGVGVSSLSNAAVATMGDIMVSGLRMESSVTLTSYAAAFGGNACITLNQVEIDLAGLSYVQTGNTYMYDLSGMFSGFSDMELTSVYLDASSVFEGVLAEGSRIEVNFGLGESALDIDKLAVLLGNGMMSLEMGFSGNNVVFYGVQEIPEPATGTLSLLALAALCARRRRQK